MGDVLPLPLNNPAQPHRLPEGSWAVGCPYCSTEFTATGKDSAEGWLRRHLKASHEDRPQ